MRHAESLDSISTITRDSFIDIPDENGNLSVQAPKVRRKCAPFTQVFPVGGCPAEYIWKFERLCPQTLEERQAEFDMMMDHIKKNFKNRGTLRYLPKFSYIVSSAHAHR